MISNKSTDTGSPSWPYRVAVVTGAAGFLGKCLCSRLAAGGLRVVGIDLRTTGVNVPEGVLLHRADLLDFGALSGLLADAAGDRGADCVVFHLAGESHAGICRKEPLRAHTMNVTATAHVLEACRRARVRRVVFPSTGLVYRSPSMIPLSEETPVAAASVYTATKLAAEALLAGYAVDHDFSCSVARLGNVYGPGAHEDTVASILVSQARVGGPLEVERLSPVRDFIYRDDAVEGLAVLGAVGKTAGWRVFNLSSGRAVTIGELALAVCRAAGLPEAVGEKGSTGERREDSRVLSIGKIMDYARWKPAWTLEEGLARTLAEPGRGVR